MSTKEKVKTILAHLQHLEDQPYHLSGQVYEVIYDIRDMVMMLFPKEAK